MFLQAGLPTRPLKPIPASCPLDSFHQPEACKYAIVHSLRTIQTISTITIIVPTNPNPSIDFLL